MLRGLIALALLGSVALQSSPSPDFPSRKEFAAGVRDALRRDAERLNAFTYLEHRRDVKISRLGKVTVGPPRTFEVYPSAGPGGAYKRLIAVDGKPLSPEELAERDAQHQKDLAEAAAREARETAGQRAARRRRAEEERQRRAQLIEDAVAVYQATIVGREQVDGAPVLVADLKPRADADVETREGRWMKRFAGRLWVAEADYQLVRLEMRAIEDVTIGWGVIGRLHEGSRLRYVRRRIGETWLPAELTYEASGRTLLFRPFEIVATTTYSDYKKR